MSRPLFVWDLEVQFLLKGLAYNLTENYQRVSFLSWTLLPEDTGTGTSFLLMRQLAPQHGLPKTHFIHSVSESRMDNKLSKDRQINIEVRERKAVKKKIISANFYAMKTLKLLCLYVCTRAGVCINVCLCRPELSVWHRYHPTPFLFRQAFSLNLLTNLARICSQQVPGTLLSLSPNPGVTGTDNNAPLV